MYETVTGIFNIVLTLGLIVMLPLLFSFGPSILMGEAGLGMGWFWKKRNRK